MTKHGCDSATKQGSRCKNTAAYYIPSLHQYACAPHLRELRTWYRHIGLGKVEKLNKKGGKK